jgi:ABC-type uncharacterized transport system YnjBCD permease subunit
MRGKGRGRQALALVWQLRMTIVGVLFCVAFVLVSFSLRWQSKESRMLMTADRLGAPRAKRRGPIRSSAYVLSPQV